MMLGYLLARAGIDVTVLEKHPDFLRDFRGDTIHPSTLEVMHELGLAEELLQQPHEKASQLKGVIGVNEFVMADLSRLPVRSKFIALMPQWDFLNFLSSKAKAYPNFKLLMQTKATGLIEENGKVKGVTANTPDGEINIRAELTIGADGRHSTIREKAGLEVKDIGAPIDVLWMRISRLASDPEQPVGRFDRGQVFVMIYRGTYWQCAYVIPKGEFENIKAKGLEEFRRNIAHASSFLGERANEITDWDQVKLLTVTVDRLKKWWRPGLLCIGDSAHAMSPIGGIGINLAIQDAVAAANILIPAFRKNKIDDSVLANIQKRRAWPTKLTQFLQVMAQNRILRPAISGNSSRPSRLGRWITSRKWLRFVTARIVGMGFRPEHVSKDIF